MNLRRITKNYYPPAHEHEAKRGYKLRRAEDLEAMEEIDGFLRRETKEPTPGRYSTGCEEVYHP